MKKIPRDGEALFGVAYEQALETVDRFERADQRVNEAIVKVFKAYARLAETRPGELFGLDPTPADRFVAERVALPLVNRLSVAKEQSGDGDLTGGILEFFPTSPEEASDLFDRFQRNLEDFVGGGREALGVLKRVLGEGRLPTADELSKLNRFRDQVRFGPEGQRVMEDFGERIIGLIDRATGRGRAGGTADRRRRPGSTRNPGTGVIERGARLLKREKSFFRERDRMSGQRLESVLNGTGG